MRVYTPSEFVQEVRGVLHEFQVTIQGEVSGLHINQGRLVFFDLKDDVSRVQCFLLAHELQRIGVELKDGEEIRVIGYPSLYVRSGGFHVKVSDIQLFGKGALQKAFEELKRKFEQEGLFEQARKRALPVFPATIGLITSSDAAAYTDVLRILRNRYPLARVLFHETRVQGIEALPQIVRAFAYFNEHPKSADVLILTRGGGSLEDLQAFNSEDVCRAVFASKIPVVCGVGHERDVTLAELVADVRASTPSNAAELAVPDRAELLVHLGDEVRAQVHIMDARVSAVSHEIRHGARLLEDVFRARRENMVRALHHFAVTSSRMAARIVTLQERITHTARELLGRLDVRLGRDRDLLAHLRLRLLSLGPEQVLARGYSMTTVNGKIVKRVGEVQTGDALVTRLRDGQIESDVVRTAVIPQAQSEK